MEAARSVSRRQPTLKRQLNARLRTFFLIRCTSIAAAWYDRPNSAATGSIGRPPEDPPEQFPRFPFLRLARGLDFLQRVLNAPKQPLRLFIQARDQVIDVVGVFPQQVVHRRVARGLPARQSATRS